MKTFQIATNSFITLFIILSYNINSYAEDSGLANLFQKRGVEGTIIISSLDNKVIYIHNDSRSEKRFSPASTFKIPNTLIALEEEAIKDENEIIKWDGMKRSFEAWNKDHTLLTAFPVSCVWFYQELARRIGKDKYIKYLKQLLYGNQKYGPELTTYWLQGDLKISAKEQINLLKKIYKNEVPFKQSNIEILKKIMIVENNPEYTIRAKTGTNPSIAWYVGYVESSNDVWFFALNIAIKNMNDARFRNEIIKEALKQKKIVQ